MKAIVLYKVIIVCNENLTLDQNIVLPSEDLLAETEVMVQTRVPISIDEELAGVLVIFNPLKPGARDVRSIHKLMKVKSIIVTDDNWGTENSIAKEVGMELPLLKSNLSRK